MQEFPEVSVECLPCGFMLTMRHLVSLQAGHQFLVVFSMGQSPRPAAGKMYHTKKTRTANKNLKEIRRIKLLSSLCKFDGLCADSPPPSSTRGKAGRNQLNEEITPSSPLDRRGLEPNHIKFRTCSATSLGLEAPPLDSRFKVRFTGCRPSPPFLYAREGR